MRAWARCPVQKRENGGYFSKTILFLICARSMLLSGKRW